MPRASKRKMITRRQFVRQSTRVGLFGIAAAEWPFPKPASGADKGFNPFAYDVTRLTKTDPKLLRYEEVGRIVSAREPARRIALGPADRIYVVAGNYVTVLDQHGSLLSEIALSGPGRCLAVSGEAEVFVGLRDHVEVYDKNGQRRATWPALSERAWLTGLALSEKNVFLADAGNRVVLRCDRSGKVLNRIGEKNKERDIPGFIVPSPFFDLEMHRDGLLRVANPGRHRVEVYTVEGDLELSWGKTSNGIDGFCGCCNPINIALLPDGRMITCEKGLPRVKVYTADGTFECVVAGAESFPKNAKASCPQGLSDCRFGGLDAAVDSLGRVYILDLVTAEIRMMAPKRTAGKTSLPPAAVPGAPSLPS